MIRCVECERMLPTNPRAEIVAHLIAVHAISPRDAEKHAELLWALSAAADQQWIAAQPGA